MSARVVSYLDLLHELCLQRGYAVLLTARHDAASFARRSSTELRTLRVAQPAPERLFGSAGRRQRLLRGTTVARCRLDVVDGDLEAAAELLVGLLAQTGSKAA